MCPYCGCYDLGPCCDGSYGCNNCERYFKPKGKKPHVRADNFVLVKGEEKKRVLDAFCKTMEQLDRMIFQERRK